MWRYRLQDRFGDVDLVPARWLETRDKPRTAVPTREDILTWMVGDTDYYIIIDAIRACDEVTPNLWALNPEQVDVWVFRTLTRLFTARDLFVVDVVWPVPPPGIVKKVIDKDVLGPAEEVPSQFEIEVLDDAGKPVSGLELKMSLDGTSRSLVTDGSGIAKVEGKSPSSNTARFAVYAKVKEVVRPRFAKDAPKDWSTFEWPDEHHKLAVLGKEPPLAKLVDGKRFTLVLARPNVRVRLIGMHFDTDKCFLRPSAIVGVKELLEVVDICEEPHVIVCGHTDTVGDDEYNLGLSVERAEATQAFLKRDVAAWEAWFDAKKPRGKVWGTREIAAMIGALACTPKTIESFQAWSNSTRGSALVVDGKAGKETKKELITAYMALAAEFPKSLKVFVHGLGEFFPEKETGDKVACEDNRRVELLCFDGSVSPKVPGPRGKKGEAEYPAWLKQIVDTRDVTTADVVGPLHVSFDERLDAKTPLVLRDGEGRELRRLTREEHEETYLVEPDGLPEDVRFYTVHDAAEGATHEVLRPTPFHLRLLAAPTGRAAPTPKPAVAVAQLQIDVKFVRCDPMHPLLAKARLTIDGVGVNYARRPGDRSPTPATHDRAKVKKVKIELIVEDPAGGKNLVEAMDYADWNDAAGTFTFRRTTAQSVRISTTGVSPSKPVAGKTVLSGDVGLTLEVDLCFLNVTSIANKSFEELKKRTSSKRDVLVAFECTAKDAPMSWLVVVPTGFDRKRPDVNYVLQFRHELGATYTDYGDAPYEAQAKYLAPTSAEFVEDGHSFRIYIPGNWFEQLEAQKNVLLVMPLPKEKTNFGTLEHCNQASIEIAQTSLLCALWAEEIAGTGSYERHVRKGRLAIGGWSSGTDTLQRWIVSGKPAEQVDVIYFFDGKNLNNLPMTLGPNAGPAPIGKLKLRQWLDVSREDKSERHVVLIHTNYTHGGGADPGWTEKTKCSHATEWESGIPTAPKPPDSIARQTVYQTALAGTPLDMVAPSTVTALLEGKEGAKALRTSTDSLTLLTGLYVEPTNPTSLFNGQWILKAKLASGRVATAAAGIFQGTTIRELSTALRYLLADAVYHKTILPLTSPAELDVIAGWVADTPGSEGYLGGRMRHGWSIGGMCQPPSEAKPIGIFAYCLRQSKFV